MSPESVTISTFRQIAHHQNGHADHVHVAASPHVAAQIEFWYEDELRRLERARRDADRRARRSGRASRERRWSCGARASRAAADSRRRRVRSRVAQHAPADRDVGRRGRQRPLDRGRERGQRRRQRDQGAHPRRRRRRHSRRAARSPVGLRRLPASARSAAAAVAAAASRSRPAEQQEELRELAEEAAKGLGARPGPVIGISTTEEAAAEEPSALNEGDAASTSRRPVSQADRDDAAEITRASAARPRRPRTSVRTAGCPSA